ncbi:MAG: hypothetical protein ABSB78_06510 [Bacteroidota bacterium]
MKNRFFTLEHSEIIYAPLLLLALFFSSILVSSFHEHHCNGTTDDCAICRFQNASFTMPATLVSAVALFQRPLPERAITLNYNATDPSQKLVCASHAPPQFN